MSERRLYGLGALFDSPARLITAARAVADHGYQQYDSYSSYPIHGLDNAMKLKHSKIGIVTLIAGLTGAVLLVLFTWWTNSVDFPVVIGGKPYFAWPDYVPLMFELTVLSGAVTTVVVLLAVWLDLPRNSHPLQDTEFMKKVSVDKFGICIEADDPKFKESETKRFLESLGAESVDTIYDEPVEHTLKQNVLDPKFIGAIVVVAVVSSACTYLGFNKMILIRPWSSLNEQFKVNPESESSFYGDKFAMRQPVDGTVARGELPDPITVSDNIPAAEKYLANPVQPTPHVLMVGERDFNIYCSPCHGYYADGNGRLQGQFPSPPSLHTDSLRIAPDGLFYNVITNGFQGIMPSYARQIPREERWAIVWYIRALQKTQNPNGPKAR
ncbi:MAG: quinol:electron acceptor oxidoreductase subunit ActD [Candidatus Kryptoniota bacterium]